VLFPSQREVYGGKSRFFRNSLALALRKVAVGILPRRLMQNGAATRRCKKFEDMYNRFDRIPACDRRTDGWTDILRRHSRRYVQHRAVRREAELSGKGKYPGEYVQAPSPLLAVPNVTAHSTTARVPIVRCSAVLM